tara:strand:+ start:322 stop:507 length:186 start_codon:yes stop_codon:yes gene_type:complete
MRSTLTHYHRHLAVLVAGALMSGAPLPQIVGPQRGRVLMLGAKIAARVERSAPVASLVEVR